MSPAPKSPSLTSDELSFLQARVARFGFAAALLGIVFLAFRTLVILGAALSSPLSLLDPAYLAHCAAIVPLLFTWLANRTPTPRSRRFISASESLGLTGSCFGYLVMGTFIPIIASPEMTTLVALTYGMVARAAYVPSSARRTFALALVIGAGYLTSIWFAYSDIPAEYFALDAWKQQGIAPENARWSQVLAGAVWWALSALTATGISNVIYGLRREVRDVKRLGQYTLDEKLGEGGMGVVYRAHHAMLRRPTAIKLLPPEKAGEAAVARFEREVQLTARLTHPNTVTIFDYGRTPEGVFYYAMELLEGATLAEVVEVDGPQAAARVVKILRAVAGALGEAHGIGLIHRDIKPANVLLTTRGGARDVAKVVDFGLVKELERTTRAALTIDTAITGTPQYMPPEAIMRPDSVDARSDLYSLGAVAYFLLTGEHVFLGETAVEVCSHHLHSPVEPPSQRLGKPIAPELEQLVMDCLAKNPDLRPPSARALENRLARLVETPGVGVWTDDDARRWWADFGELLVRDRASSQTGMGVTATLEVDFGARSHVPR